MGSFYVNHQVRADSADPVIAAARRACVGLAYVAPARNGWVAVYDEASDTQDEALRKQVAEDLSEQLATTVFTFLVHDDDVFRYILHDHGELIDAFDSWPDYYRVKEQSEGDEFQPMVESRQVSEAGNAEAVLGHCVPGTTLQQVRDNLNQDSWPLIEAAQREGQDSRLRAMDRHANLAKLLGIDPDLAQMGFGHVQERLDLEGRTGLRGLRKVRGKGTARSAQTAGRARSIGEAVEAGDVEAVKRFLALGADLHSTGSHGRSLLFLAGIGGHFEIALALLAAGVKADTADADWLFARTVHVGRPEAAPALVAAGVPLRNQALLAAVFPMVSDRPTPEQTKALEALIVAGADVNGRGREGMTPLTLAVESGHPEFVKVLLHAGADINLQGQNGRTALICAIMREARSSSPRFVRLLLDSGADPNIRDDWEMTALMYAASHPFDDKKAASLVSMLLRAGANVKFETRERRTALSMAVEARHAAAAKLLGAAGAK